MSKKLLLLSSLTIFSYFFLKKIIVLGMIIVGAVIFPEASLALRHYCFGHGEKLIVESNYFEKSSIIQNHLKKMKIGDKKMVWVNRFDDFRLSSAINNFSLEKKKNKVIIKQWMYIRRSNDIFTWFGPIPVPITGNMVHTFNCTPYLFYHEFPLNSSY
jgi:hypothetical protein